ncbi:amidohydrolase [Anaeropeptidivorans aminofermentans]|jgi:imidazolonepropionase-like amidohydrolase|uniref:amidohydrolase n=1 Tax=Anaeropeptidivorans aminofermentans TaxID=2934315 RepID=UPI00202408C7|nr:amidohydrolase [Anaeropeptidivorans aminofermentans]MBE6011702.1 amidohydrolase [Lachnospiraceae bacterium]
MLLLKNCLLSNMADIWEEETAILIENGKIKEIGKNLNAPDAEVIDAKGRIVTPGLIDSHCHTGTEDTGTDAAGDVNETTNPALAGLRIIDALHFYDKSFETALRTGVTTVVTGPGSANIIGGTFAAIKTYYGDLNQRVINPEICMKMALGENPKLNYGKRSKAPSTRMMNAAIMREQLFLAKQYREKWLEYNEKIEKGENPPEFKFDIHKHSLMRVFDGMLVKIHCHQSDDIITAMRIASEFNLRYTLDHCTEGYLITDELKQYNPMCILGPVFGGKSKLELRSKSFKGAGILEENGIFFSIATDHPVIPHDTLLIQAALMVKNGLSRKAALKALTVNAAISTDIADRVGTIEPGKDADIVIWQEDPILSVGDPEMVIIDGEIRYQRGEQ